MKKLLLLPLLVWGLGVVRVNAEPHLCSAINPSRIASGPEKSFRSAAPNLTLWQPGDTIRIRFLGGSVALQERIKAVAKQWTDHANIHFEYVAAEPSDVRIGFAPGGSWSFVGTECKGIPDNKATMNFGWFTDATDDREISRTTLHEFGHMLGMIHEHQSPTAYIPWDKPKVYAYYAATQNPPWTPAEVDHNIFTTYDAANTNFSGFDRESIMLYAIPNDLTEGDYEVAWNTQLSDIDKQHVAKIYPGAVAPSYRVTLKRLKCLKSQELTGDDVQVRVFVDGNRVDVAHPQETPFNHIPIKRFRKDDSFNLNQAFDFTRTLQVEIWDIDNPDKGDPHDLFGVVTIAGNGPGGERLEDNAGDLQISKHRYQLDWE